MFDTYNELSIKCSECRERTRVEGIETIITSYDQTILVEMIDSDLCQKARSHLNNSFHSGLTQWTQWIFS